MNEQKDPSRNLLFIVEHLQALEAAHPALLGDIRALRLVRMERLATSGSRSGKPCHAPAGDRGSADRCSEGVSGDYFVAYSTCVMYKMVNLEVPAKVRARQSGVWYPAARSEASRDFGRFPGCAHRWTGGRTWSIWVLRTDTRIYTRRDANNPEDDSSRRRVRRAWRGGSCVDPEGYRYQVLNQRRRETRDC